MSGRRGRWTASVLLMVIVFNLVAGWRLLQPGLQAEPGSTESPVAVINGVALTTAMIDRELRISRFNPAEPLPPLNGTDLERAREEALNQLLARQVVLQAAAREGFALPAETIAEQARLLFGSFGDEALDQALAQSGSSRDDLLWWVGEVTTVEAYTSQVVLAGAPVDDRQAVYNAWLNEQQRVATIELFTAGEAPPVWAQVGEPAPDFELARLDGQAASLSDYAGQVVLVNFWATWCPSCLSEMPAYEQVYQAHQPELVVLAINSQESLADVQQYAAGLGLSFPVLLDTQGLVTQRQYQVTGLPASFIIDRHGKIYYRHLGPLSAQTLTTKLAELGL